MFTGRSFAHCSFPVAKTTFGCVTISRSPCLLLRPSREGRSVIHTVRPTHLVHSYYNVSGPRVQGNAVSCTPTSTPIGGRRFIYSIFSVFMRSAKCIDISMLAHMQFLSALDEVTPLTAWFWTHPLAHATPC